MRVSTGWKSSSGEQWPENEGQCERGERGQMRKWEEGEGGGGKLTGRAGDWDEL